MACRPQAWAAGTIPYLMKTGLGLRPAAVDLSFERDGRQVRLAGARVGGDAEVVSQVEADQDLT